MITKDMILAGISAGVVKLIDSPHDLEPACQIGDHWLYYAGSEGMGLTSAEYAANVPLDDIASEIVCALEGIRDDLDEADEYRYYEAVLEFREGEPVKGDRDMRSATIYDIAEVENA